MAQPTNAITAEYLRQLRARRAPAGSPGPWRRRSELERLIDRTVLELHPTLGSCWVWTGPATPYGRISKAQDTYTHRLGWKLLRGAIPKGKELHHRCERHACWNPDHLKLVTHAQNRAYSRKDECKHGHPLVGENLYLDPAGLRYCRACLREGQRQLRQRVRATTRDPGRPDRRPGPPRSDLERLIDRTVLELHPTLGSCWVWTGPASPYGRIEKGPARSERSTHRLGWMILRGPIPEAMELHHRCEVPACWNPDHLQVVTHAQNLAHTRKTHCKHGHPLAGANLYLAPGASGSAGSAIGRPSGRFRRGIAPRGPLSK